MMESSKASHRETAVSGFWHELLDELYVLESRTAHWVLQAADPTSVEIRRLQSCFELTDQVRQTQETADHEQLKCLVCGHEYFARGIITVQPCDHCGGNFFAVGQAH